MKIRILEILLSSFEIGFSLAGIQFDDGDFKSIFGLILFPKDSMLLILFLGYALILDFSGDEDDQTN